MIVLRNKVYAFEEREYAIPSIRRRIRWIIGKARTKAAERLINANNVEVDAQQAHLRMLKVLPPVKNPKVENFLRKIAANRRMLVTNMLPVRTLRAGGTGAFYQSRLAPKVTANSLLYNTVMSPESKKVGSLYNILTDKYVHRLERLAGALKGPDARSLIYFPRNGATSGVETLAHEEGHGSATGWMRVLSRNPIRQREFLDRYKKFCNKLLAHGPEDDGNSWRGKLGTVVKTSVLGDMEERRASREAIKLLQQSGEMSPEEMKRAIERLKIAYNTHKHYNRASILGSLAEKIQIPSRRDVESYYAKK